MNLWPSGGAYICLNPTSTTLGGSGDHRKRGPMFEGEAHATVDQDTLTENERPGAPRCQAERAVIPGTLQRRGDRARSKANARRLVMKGNLVIPGSDPRG